MFAIPDDIAKIAAVDGNTAAASSFLALPSSLPLRCIRSLADFNYCDYVAVINSRDEGVPEESRVS